MFIKSIELENFLSYTRQNISFNDGLNVIYGENASGKTNLLDSVFLTAIGRSSRNLKDKELINWENKEYCLVTMKVKKKYSEHTLKIHIDSQNKKRVLIDDLPIKRLGDLMGTINVVFFSPEELKLVKNAPEDRRRFIDISLSQQNKTYFYSLIKYNKLLKQRNKILKDYKNSPNLDNLLQLLEGDLLDSCSYIIQKRVEFIKEFTPFAKLCHLALTDNKENLCISYESDVKDFDNIKDELKRLLKLNYERDKRLEYTSVGAHRDDLNITSNDIDLRKYGSQGQKRTAVLSLKLAEIKLFIKLTNETPILLLDDVLSELDEKRRNSLFDAIKGIQTLITCTEIDGNIKYEYKKLLIKDKKVIQK